MGQAKLRKAEILQLKKLGDNGKAFAINFKFHLDEEPEYRYNMLAVYKPNTIEQIRANNYDNDKCFNIIYEASHNLLVRKAGNADMTDAKQVAAIEDSMRVVALAVLRMAIIDPYKEIVIRPDTVLEMELAEVDNQIGFNLIEGMPVLLVERGVQQAIDAASKSGVDFIVNL